MPVPFHPSGSAIGDTDRLRLDVHASRMFRAGRDTVRRLPPDRRFSCWRCDEFAAQSSNEPGWPVAA